MAIQYTTRVDGDTLLVEASGFDGSLDEVLQYGMGILEACLASGVTRVLCNELSLEYRLGTVDTFRAGEFMSAHVPAVARVAIVCNPKYVAEGRFWEDVVVNRGLRVHVFTEVTPAVAWLRQTAAAAAAEVWSGRSAAAPERRPDSGSTPVGP